MEAQGLLDPCKKMERTIKYWTQVQEIESEPQLCCCQLWSVEKVTTLLKSLILFSLKLLPLEACAAPVTEQAPSNWQLTLSPTYLQVRKLTYSFSIFSPRGVRGICVIVASFSTLNQLNLPSWIRTRVCPLLTWIAKICTFPYLVSVSGT